MFLINFLYLVKTDDWNDIIVSHVQNLKITQENQTKCIGEWLGLKNSTKFIIWISDYRSVINTTIDEFKAEIVKVLSQIDNYTKKGYLKEKFDDFINRESYYNKKVYEMNISNKQKRIFSSFKLLLQKFITYQYVDSDTKAISDLCEAFISLEKRDDILRLQKENRKTAIDLFDPYFKNQFGFDFARPNDFLTNLDDYHPLIKENQDNFKKKSDEISSDFRKKIWFIVVPSVTGGILFLILIVFLVYKYYKKKNLI